MSVGANAASASAYYSSLPPSGSAPGVASFSSNSPGANMSAGGVQTASNGSLPNAPGPNSAVPLRADSSAMLGSALNARSLNKGNGNSIGIGYSVDSIGTPREFKPEYASLLKAETIGPVPLVHKPENTSRKVVEAQNSGMLALIIGCGIVGIGTFAGIPILWEALGKTQRTQFKSMMEKIKDKVGDHLDGKHLNEADERLVKLAREIFQEDAGKNLRAFYKPAHANGNGRRPATDANAAAGSAADANGKTSSPTDANGTSVSQTHVDARVIASGPDRSGSANVVQSAARQSGNSPKWRQTDTLLQQSPLRELSKKLNDAALEDGHDLHHGIIAEAERTIFQARAVVMHKLNELAQNSDDGDLKAFVAQQHDNFFGAHSPQQYADLRDSQKLEVWHSDWLQSELGIERERHTRFVDAVIDQIIQRTARPTRTPYLAELR